MTGSEYRHGLTGLAFVIWLIWGTAGYAQTPPPLPPGLAPSLSPAPPAESGRSAEPALPSGLGEMPSDRPTEAQEEDHVAWPIDLSGFGESRLGLRTQDNPHERAVSIGETRLQLRLETIWKRATLKLEGDFLYDPVLDRHKIRLETGTGWLDLRQANVHLRLTNYIDLKIGRQILTWGTGDLIFINDLFPKDFQSFFIGRDPAYLKAPSDAFKISLFSHAVNLDVIYTPRFDADRFINGRRLSFFNPQLGRRSGRDAVVQSDRPDAWFRDDELALRLYTTVRSYEVALYGYHGFWKSPAGVDPDSGQVTFPALSVYGASLRGALGRGIAHLEMGYYDSTQDRDGDNPLIRNSEFRLLLGYEQDLAKDFTAGFQYLLTHMFKHQAFRRTLPPDTPVADENRHLVTMRLTQRLFSQNLRLSLFVFYAPSDQDAYLRPIAHYRLNDHWSVEIGANLLVGAHVHTFFGQLADNSNVYGGWRYSF